MFLDHNIEFLGYYGSDESHLQALYLSPHLEERMKNTDMRLKDLRKAIEEQNFKPFENSTFTFLLKTDLLTYYTFIQDKIVNINDAPFKGKFKEELKSYYIPPDLRHRKIKTKIKDFAEPEENWFNLLIKFTELGQELEKEFLKFSQIYYNPNRMYKISKYFKVNTNHIEYSITLNFYEFIKFFEKYAGVNSIAETQELAYFMLDTIKKLPNLPFKQSLLAFELNKK
jgi:hypothetical protein